jgi:hypothetical protein
VRIGEFRVQDELEVRVVLDLLVADFYRLALFNNGKFNNFLFKKHGYKG